MKSKMKWSVFIKNEQAGIISKINVHFLLYGINSWFNSFDNF